MKRIAHLVAAGLLLSLPAAAHTPQQPPHQLYGEGDLKLESGEAIKDFSISYVTHGKLNEKKSNAILMVTAISGNHHRIDFMIGPGKALDPDKYFIICTDAIGNGLTTSPSNSKAQPRMSFPKFTIRDMVESQYRLMKEKLGIDHVADVEFRKLHARLRPGIARRGREAVGNRVGADDEIFLGIERPAGADHEVEPVMIA